MANIALSFAYAIFSTQLSPLAVYFIQTGGSALSNTQRGGSIRHVIQLYLINAHKNMYILFQIRSSMLASFKVCLCVIVLSVTVCTVGYNIPYSTIVDKKLTKSTKILTLRNKQTYIPYSTNCY